MCYTTNFVDNGSKADDADGIITAQVQVPADSVWFDGHFPEIAVLPGVAQLAVIVDILSEVLQKKVRPVEVSRVRFKLAIMPAETVTVQIMPNKNASLAYGFRLSKGQELACSGFIKVAAGASNIGVKNKKSKRRAE